jgi:hypothetical protein
MRHSLATHGKSISETLKGGSKNHTSPVEDDEVLTKYVELYFLSLPPLTQFTVVQARNHAFLEGFMPKFAKKQWVWNLLVDQMLCLVFILGYFTSIT